MGTSLLNVIKTRLLNSKIGSNWDCVLTELEDSNCYTFCPKNYCFIEYSYQHVRSIVGINSGVNGLFTVFDYDGKPNIGIRFFASKRAFFPNQLY